MNQFRFDNQRGRPDHIRTVEDSDSGEIVLEPLNVLVQVDLSGLAAVNSDVLKSICEGCPELVRLVLRSCTYLGEEGIKAVELLEKIELIDVSGCLLITASSVQYLINAFSVSKKVRRSL